MRVLVTGVKGQLGYDVVNEMLKRGLEPVGVDVDEMDITDKAACEKVITESNVDAVIHCAAYTAVDAAEDNVEICMKVNAEGTRNIIYNDSITDFLNWLDMKNYLNIKEFYFSNLFPYNTKSATQVISCCALLMFLADENFHDSLSCFI